MAIGTVWASGSWATNAWAANSWDDLAIGVQYLLEYSEDNNAWGTIGTWQTARSASFDTHLARNGTVYFRVRARDGDAPLDLSGYGTLTVTVDNPIVSGAHTNIKTHRSPGRSTSRSRY